MSIFELTAYELRDKIVRRELSAVEVARSFVERAENLDGRLGAFLLLTPELALNQAEAVDRKLQQGEEIGALAGVPVALKDNLCTEGITTTCASKILGNFIAPYTATVVERLAQEDAVFIGKTNMDEFAMGSSTENSAFKPARNPWAEDRVPGGSSGGSAVAVASGMAISALGSDTGGSIRQPASLCGVVGLKPTYGRVSRYGLVAFASSLDQIGPITKDVRDSALLLGVISGHDRKDSTSSPEPVPDYLASLERDIKGLKAGLPREYFSEGIDPEVEARVMEAVGVLESMGVEVSEISLPHTEYAVATYYIIATAEASSNLARYDGVHYGYRSPCYSDFVDMYSRSRREGFGVEVKRRIMLGTYVLSAGYYDAYYLKASRVRTLIKRDFEEAFKRVDVILCPTSPTPAFRLGEKTEDPLQMYLSDIYTISANLAGIAGISVPCGLSSDGLPIGLQILAKHFDEETLIMTAYHCEREIGRLRCPLLSSKNESNYSAGR